jgi:hypothetical protein
VNAPFQQPVSSDEHQQQLDRALHWFASYIQEFAQAELIVGDCVHLFTATKKAGVRVKSGQQIRAAIAEVQRLTTGKGAFAKVGKPLALSLDTIEREHLDWRAHLTHGVLNVWRGRKGQWLITLQYRETDNAGPVRWHAIPFVDAKAKLEAMAEQVHKFRQRFDAVERQLRKVD